jgi:hypothetical protein
MCHYRTCCHTVCNYLGYSDEDSDPANQILEYNEQVREVERALDLYTIVAAGLAVQI